MENKIIEYVYKHPPRCIIDLHPKPTMYAKPSIRKPWPHSVHHSEFSKNDTASFVIGCPCGHRAVFLLGYYVNRKHDTKIAGFAGPLSIECAKCSTVTDFFDTRIHGYDGEQGINTYIIGEGAPEKFACPHCGVNPLIICAHISYQVSEDYKGKLKYRREDYFDGLAIVGHCTNCNNLIEVTHFECE